MAQKHLNGIYNGEIPKKNLKTRSETKKTSLFSKAAIYLVENQIEFPLGIIAAITTAFALNVPGSEKFVILQYRDSETGLYSKGIEDAYFVFFWVALFTLLRASAMEYILIPIGRQSGIKSNSRCTRFAEQGWSFLYYSIFWTLGMYIMYHSPHWFDTTQFWKGYPHSRLNYLTKWYYLVQFAFWLQQVFVLQIEKRRKDFAEMIAHHAITISLMGLSYIFNYTRIGNAVLCIMDFADIILPLAKMLKYLNFTKMCDILFGVFMVSWVITRHYFYGYIIYSTWVQPGQYIETKWSYEEEHYFTQGVQWFFLALFLSLQAIIIFWFVLICQVAFRVVRGDNAHDNRSESESGEEALNIHGKANGNVLSHKSKKST
ncbi:hypothetical protein G9A89_015126 [Geosiphon pyriformis]|nr:hypothetical protein G9A89_015126 [Geosiphon pyriformis]